MSFLRSTICTKPSASMRARSPECSQPSTKVSAVASGLFQYPFTTLEPRTRSSPTPECASSSNSFRSTTGAANPTESGRLRAYTCGREVATDVVSVRPNPLPTRGFGESFHDAAHQRGCDGRASVGQPLDGAHVDATEIGLIQGQ